ncbi:hypothetical protein AVEN_158246-1 [Araneus ventricosus]|uniref:Paired domain-containing protein n=1 Tax=Araneus ventricosus TaxID=182803 RepID=A0A4Y2FNM4_ARAVE|nr:hypothetical protein AVEN_158246-1 [Araneus ventricosus]
METGSIRPGVIGGNRPKGAVGDQEHKDDCRKDNSSLFNWEGRDRLSKDSPAYNRMLGQTKISKGDDLDSAQKGSGGHKHSIDGILSKKRAFPLKPGLFGRKRHELDSPNLGGHLPDHTLLKPSLKAHGNGLCLAKISDLRTSSPLKRSQPSQTSLRRC